MAAQDETQQIVGIKATSISPLIAAVLQQELDRVGEPVPKWLVEWIESVTGLPFEEAEQLIGEALAKELEGKEEGGVTPEKLGEIEELILKSGNLPPVYEIERWLEELDRIESEWLANAGGRVVRVDAFEKQRKTLVELMERVKAQTGKKETGLPGEEEARAKEVARELAGEMRKTAEIQEKKVEAEVIPEATMPVITKGGVFVPPTKTIEDVPKEEKPVAGVLREEIKKTAEREEEKKVEAEATPKATIPVITKVPLVDLSGGSVVPPGLGRKTEEEKEKTVEPKKIEISETARRIAQIRMTIDYSQKGFWGLTKHVLSQAASPVTGIAGAYWGETEEDAQSLGVDESEINLKKKIYEAPEQQFLKDTPEEVKIDQLAVPLVVGYGLKKEHFSQAIAQVIASDLPEKEKQRYIEQLSEAGAAVEEYRMANPDFAKKIDEWFGVEKVSFVLVELEREGGAEVELSLAGNGNMGVTPLPLSQAPFLVRFTLGQLQGLGMQGLRKVASPAIKAGTKKAAGWLATKLGIHAIAQAIGTSVPVIGNLLAFVLAFVGTEVLGKLWGVLKNGVRNLLSWLGILGKKEGSEKWWLPALGIGGGLLLLPIMPVLGAVLLGIGLLVGGLALAGSAGAIVAGVGAAGAAVWGIMISGALPGALTISLLVGGALGLVYLQTHNVETVLIAAFSGPAKETSEFIGEGLPVSKYISVSKVASQTKIDNPSVVTPIEYVVRITARDEKLTNIKFTNRYQVVGKGKGKSPTTSGIPAPPKEIAAGETFSFAYKADLTMGQADSVVVDTFTVTATAKEQVETAATSATVLVGSPPTECFVLADGFSEVEKARILGAIGVINGYTRYVAQLCSGGEISLLRVNQDMGYGGEVHGSVIWIFDDGVASSNAAIYTLAHESGHVYAARNAGVYLEFEELGISDEEGYIWSYPLTKSVPEDFAEMIGVYIAGPAGVYFKGGKSLDLSKEYPLHYKFAQENIF